MLILIDSLTHLSLSALSAEVLLEVPMDSDAAMPTELLL